MIVEIRAKNVYSFNESIKFSMNADMRNKKLGFNVHKINNFNVLKTAVIYGQNNAGKTCLIKCIKTIKNSLLNLPMDIMPNLFTNNPVCELGISFINDGSLYSYDFKYDTSKKEYVYEKFLETIRDKYSNEKEEIWYSFDVNDNTTNNIKDQNLVDAVKLVSHNAPICYTIDVNNFEYVNKMKKILTNIANEIGIVDLNNIPLEKTIDLLKNKNELQDKVVDFIKNADLYLEDYKYVDIKDLNIDIKNNTKPNERALNIPDSVMDQIRLASVYKGKTVPSMLFDSSGTKKIAALASYIIEGLKNGHVLVIDELDSGIHFVLTRAIVSMYNNELNDKSQLIATTHDVNLLDVKKLFRKEQIWFVDKDEERVYVYSLADFTAEDGVRDTTDVIDKYTKGFFNAIPEPELINSLIDITKRG
ncbi:MAG: ATP-binding protein [Lachnospiraceae bacterium]|nr:ATP-binding protein [Lachnospiraceae bacterium]